MHDGALIGTGSIVLHRAVVEPGRWWARARSFPTAWWCPSGAMALGVPAKFRADSVDDEEIAAQRRAVRAATASATGASSAVID